MYLDIFSTFLDSIRATLGGGTDLPAALTAGLERLVGQAQASAAWIYWLDGSSRALRRAAAAGAPANLPAEIDAPYEGWPCFARLALGGLHASELSTCACLASSGHGEAVHWSVPLRGSQGLVGVLTVVHERPPDAAAVDRQALDVLERGLGTLFELLRLHEETQVYATQTAFVALLARSLNERLDLQSILSLTLEQAVILLNATGGSIWLAGPGRRTLELASALSPSLRAQPDHLEWGHGLIGGIAARGALLHTGQPSAEPGFDPHDDLVDGSPDYTLLAVPLRHHDIVTGVVALYGAPWAPFARQDVALLEGVCALAASAIANAQLIRELRDGADQQRVFYEMSQQLAAGLDLRATLRRAIQWASSLVETESSLLWLARAVSASSLDPQRGPKGAGGASRDLELVAVQGFGPPTDRGVTMSFGQGVTGGAAAQLQPLIVNEPQSDARIDLRSFEAMGVRPHNLLGVPMIYQGELIGVLTFVNKVGGPFNGSDLQLLSTAGEMIALAVGNARLHTQTVSLLEERERLQEQMLQRERLVALGRLTAGLSHEINNPMQAIRGALTLALEELDSPADVEHYVRLSLQESERVVQLISRLRQIYRPENHVPERLDLNALLHEVQAVSRKELARGSVRLRMEPAARPLFVRAIANQLQLVLLNFVLNLGEAIGAAGGGELGVRLSAHEALARIELATDAPIVIPASLQQMCTPVASEDDLDNSFGSALNYAIIVALGGAPRLERQGRRTLCYIDLPLLREDA
jgi:GAF domain-containing protein